MTLQINGLVADMTRAMTEAVGPGTAALGPGGPHAERSPQFRQPPRRPTVDLAASDTVTTPGLTCEIDNLVVDAARRTVSRDGSEIRMGKLTFDLLLLLIEHSPGIVTKRQVANHLWNRRHVSPETVRQRVKLLRRALDDDPAQPRYVKVVRGQGYRLIPSVNRTRPAGLWAGIRNVPIAVLSLLALIAMVNVTVSQFPKFVASSGFAVMAGSSVAVLPFDNLSGSSADSEFLNGLHNDLLTRLARQPSLDVNSRASVLKYRNSRKGTAAIGRELKALAIVTGSIQRSGGVVRINVRLVDVRTEKYIWAEIYDRQINSENLISVQSEVTTAIVAALSRKLTIAKVDPQTSPPKT